MLERFTALWRRRFEAGVNISQAPPLQSPDWLNFVHKIYRKQLPKTAPDKSYCYASDCTGDTILTNMHELLYIAPTDTLAFETVSKRIVLQRRDVPLSSIDFHCSNILESLMSQYQVRTAVMQEITASSGSGNEPTLSEAGALALLKSSMWHCSSSTNDKCIVATGSTEPSGASATQEQRRIWKLIAQPSAQFAKHLIASRVPQR